MSDILMFILLGAAVAGAAGYVSLCARMTAPDTSHTDEAS